jgi:hypothetical protein
MKARLSPYPWVLAGVLILGSAVVWWAGSDTETEAKFMVVATGMIHSRKYIHKFVKAGVPSAV